MLRIKVNPNTIIACNSDHPDKSGRIEVQSNDDRAANFWRRQLSSMSGMRGISIGDFAAPDDIIAGLTIAKAPYQIVEGSEILELPRQKLSKGAMW